MTDQIEAFIGRLRRAKRQGATLPSRETERLVAGGGVDDVDPQGVPAGDGVVSESTKRMSGHRGRGRRPRLP